MLESSGSGAGKSTPMPHHAHRLRRELIQRTGPALLRCGLCGSFIRRLDWSRHGRQCERDCASLTIASCDRAIARLWSTEGRDEELMESLRRERYDAYTLIFGFGEHGNGRVHTGHPALPGDTPLD